MGKKKRIENQKVNKGGERGFRTHEFGTVKIGTSAKIGTDSCHSRLS